MPFSFAVHQFFRLFCRFPDARGTDLMLERLSGSSPLMDILVETDPCSEFHAMSDIFDAMPAWKSAIQDALLLEASEEEASNHLFQCGVILADAIRHTFDAESPFSEEISLVEGLEYLREMYEVTASHAGISEALRAGYVIGPLVEKLLSDSEELEGIVREAASLGRHLATKDDDANENESLAFRVNERIRTVRDLRGVTPLVLSDAYVLPVLVGMVAGGLTVENVCDEGGASGN
jgi:hypothetical protein